MVGKPPGPAGENAQAVEIALEAAVARLRIQSEGEGHRAHIIMGIDEVGSDKEFVIDARRPETELRGDEEMAPLCFHFLLPVPGEPAGPGLDAGVETEGNPFSDRDFQTDVGCRGSGIDQVGTDGDAPVAGGRGLGRTGHGVNEVHHGGVRGDVHAHGIRRYGRRGHGGECR